MIRVTRQASRCFSAIEYSFNSLNRESQSSDINMFWCLFIAMTICWSIHYVNWTTLHHLKLWRVVAKWLHGSAAVACSWLDSNSTWVDRPLTEIGCSRGKKQNTETRCDIGICIINLNATIVEHYQFSSLRDTLHYITLH